jgi:outer membrane protein OmpA-like peptidoglycan-associated protein
LLLKRVLEVVGVVLGTCGVLLASHAARAEPVLVSLEVQGAAALTTPQSELFGPGASFALGVRYPVGSVLQLGAELRAGLLSAGTSPVELGQADPGVGSFELGMLMLRLKPLASVDRSAPRRAVGLFVDLGAGGGVTGKEPRVGFQGGLGYGFSLGGGFSLAPTVRYLQVVQPSDPLSSRDARVLLYGVELTAFDARTKAHETLPEPIVVAPLPVHDEPFTLPPAPPPPAAAAIVQPHEEPDPNRDRDHDHVLDVDDQCPDEPETVNGQDDEDGCPDQGLIVLEHDRIVLDEHVLFDPGYARVKHAAWRSLEVIVRLMNKHPEWLKIRVEGHADARGPAQLNQNLSERRAKNVMKFMVGLGLPQDKIEAVGFGATRPRASGKSDEANQRNRRVEFAVITAQAPIEPPPPKPEPAKDEAPPPPLAPKAAEPRAPEHEPEKSELKPSGLVPLPAEKNR